MRRYQIHESVGQSRQEVHTYDELEIHHPSKHGREPGRVYANIDGEREEVLRNRTSLDNLMVSKDFILTDSDTKSSRVAVPSPASGYVGRVDERNGLVAIYDRKGGELIAQIRHMDLRGSGLHEGQQVKYGQPLGIQGGFGGGNPHRYGTHVHIDFNEKLLDQFKKYIRDIDSGVITPGNFPDKAKGHEDVGRSAVGRPAVVEDSVLRQGEQGSAVRLLQVSLDRLGYRGDQGNALKVDGDYGNNTYQAVCAFQQAHGLHADGVVGRGTREALRNAERSPLMSERTHPDHALFQQARAGLRELPAGTFRNSTEQDNTAATLAVQAKAAGMTGIDHVLMSTRGDGVFAVQGNPQEPGRVHISVDRAQAAAQSLEASTRLLSDHAENQQQASQVGTQMQQLEHRSGLVMGIRP